MSEDEKDVLENVIGGVERFTGSHVVLKRGDCLDQSTLLIEGFMARTIERGGRRHIVAIHVPGDFVDLHAFPLKRLDHDVISVGATTVGYVSHSILEQILEDKPHFTRILWFSTMLDAALHREWIMAMEHLNADGRLAHLIVELWHRLNFVGLAEPSGFNLSFTQIELAEACGSTAIHLNRVIRRMREGGIADIARGRVSILDMQKLTELGGFEPSYLYGKGDLMLRKELTRK